MKEIDLDEAKEILALGDPYKIKKALDELVSDKIEVAKKERNSIINRIRNIGLNHSQFGDIWLTAHRLGKHAPTSYLYHKEKPTFNGEEWSDENEGFYTNMGNGFSDSFWDYEECCWLISDYL